MTRLRSFAAAAGQAPCRSDAAVARQAPRRLRDRLRFGVVAACTAAFVFAAGSSSAYACPACFGAEESSLVEGTQLGILILLAITLTVQGAFVGFFVYLRRRAARIAQIELDTEWSELQRGASRAS